MHACKLQAADGLLTCWPMSRRITAMLQGPWLMHTAFMFSVIALTRLGYQVSGPAADTAMKQRAVNE